MQTVARIAAVIAGLALVMTSFAPVVGAQTTTTTTTTTSATTAQFNRDLTIGSTGTDVTALQAWLVARGFSIPAGPTGYFGNQTRAAVAAFQAANSIAPVAGYFGPVTRAKVNAMLTVTNPGNGTTNPGNNNGGNTGNQLRGGEADLRNFELNREESSGNEGDEEVEVATATFDVEDGDVRVERLEIYASAVNTSLNQQPWRYFDRVIILADGKEIAEEDVDSRSDWSRTGNGYRLNLNGLKHIVREGDEAEITIAFAIADSIDSANLAQEFTFHIPDRGIRATDAEGIQHYIGEASETVTFGFGEEESGDLKLSTSSDDPRSMVLIADEDRESDEYTVFVFDIENKDDVDALLTELSIDVTGLNTGVEADDVIRRATLRVDGERYTGDVTTNAITFDDLDLELQGDDSLEFELSVRLVRNATNTPIAFELNSSNIEAEGVRSGDAADISGSARSEEHTIALSGIIATNGKTTSKSILVNSTTGSEQGEYSITFDVEALEEDVYIHRSAAPATSTVNAGVVYNVYLGSEVVQLTDGELSDLIEAAGSDRGDTSEYFLVREGRTRTFTLRVVIDPVVTGFYSVELEAVHFDDERDGVSDDSAYSVPSSKEFKTSAEQLNA